MNETITNTLRKIEHNGRFIYYSDYRGLAGEQFQQEVFRNSTALVARGKSGERNMLGIVDIRDTFISQEVLEAFKQFANESKRYFKATAVVGATGMRKYLLELVNKFARIGVKPFDDIESAKEWLMKEAGS
jgi:hypothetical protein